MSGAGIGARTGTGRGARAIAIAEERAIAESSPDLTYRLILGEQAFIGNFDMDFMHTPFVLSALYKTILFSLGYDVIETKEWSDKVLDGRLSATEKFDLNKKLPLEKETAARRTREIERELEFNLRISKEQRDELNQEKLELEKIQARKEIPLNAFEQGVFDEKIYPGVILMQRPHYDPVLLKEVLERRIPARGSGLKLINIGHKPMAIYVSKPMTKEIYAQSLEIYKRLNANSEASELFNKTYEGDLPKFSSLRGTSKEAKQSRILAQTAKATTRTLLLDIIGGAEASSGGATAGAGAGSATAPASASAGEPGAGAGGPGC